MQEVSINNNQKLKQRKCKKISDWLHNKDIQHNYQIEQLNKSHGYFDNDELTKADEIVDIILGSGNLFPDTYIISLILKSKILIKKWNDKNKGQELALEAETIAIVEDNELLLIDAKINLIECFISQNKFSIIPEKLKEIEKLIDSLNNLGRSKKQKINDYEKVKKMYEAYTK